VESINPNISGKEQPGQSRSERQRATAGKRADLNSTPAGSRSNTRRREFPPRPLPRSGTTAQPLSGGLPLAGDHRLPSESPPAT